MLEDSRGRRKAAGANRRWQGLVKTRKSARRCKVAGIRQVLSEVDRICCKVEEIPGGQQGGLWKIAGVGRQQQDALEGGRGRF